MIHRYFFLPFAALLLVVFQTSVLSILFMGRLSFEISLLLVIYAGFRMNILLGALLSFLLGFFLDCAIGSITGLYSLIYVCIFFISAWVSLRVYSEQTSLIMIFAFLCSMLEGLIIVLFYKIIYDVGMFDNIFRIFLPQALLISLLSPLLFRSFYFFEVLFHGGDAKPAK